MAKYMRKRTVLSEPAVLAAPAPDFFILAAPAPAPAPAPAKKC